MLDDEQLGPRWRLFVEFFQIAPKRGDLLIIATLRKERREKMVRRPDFADLWDQSSTQKTELTFPTENELQNIVEKPFNDLRQAELAKDLVDVLVTSIREYADRYTGARVGSVLPLVSLCLQGINEKVVQPKLEERHQAGEDEDLSETLRAAASMEAGAARETGPIVITVEDAAEYAEFEGVIAELAKRSMEAAQIQASLDAQDSTLDDLLRRLVRWAGDDDKQFFLPTVPLPTETSQRALAEALIEHRLLVDEADGHMRLVHEAVLQHWPEAWDFCERERPLHESAKALQILADLWSGQESNQGIVETGLQQLGDKAYAILALWPHRFSDYYLPSGLDEADRKVRDYCLALLDAQCDPARLVEQSPKKSTHLHLATFYGRVDIVRKMLAKIPETVNIERADGRTPIHAPCFLNDVEILDVLHSYGADVDAQDTVGWRPIHGTAVGGNVDVAKWLVGKNAKIGTEGAPDALSPLHLAARHGNLNLIDYFIDELEIDPNIRDRWNQTPIVHATYDDSADAIRHLSTKGGNPAATCGATGMTALHIAARDGRERSIEALMELGVSPDAAMSNGALALHLAAHNGNTACARLLAGRVRNIDAPATNLWETNELERANRILSNGQRDPTLRVKVDWTPLHFATAEGHIETIHALIEAGANPVARTANDDTPLHLAIREKQELAAKALVGRRGDLEARDKDGNTALQHAISRGRYALADDLCSLGALIDASVTEDTSKQTFGTTLLHHAALGGDETKLTFLLRRQANATAQTKFGRTPLHIAAAAGLERNVSHIMTSEGADIFALDGEGLTPFDLACLAGASDCVDAMAARTTTETSLLARCPEALHYAASAGRARLVRRLIDRGYDPNGFDAEGRTALHVAAQDGHANVVSWLLERGANPVQPLRVDATTTAFDLAVETGQAEVLKTLLRTIAAQTQPLEAIAFRALEMMHFDVVAVILEHLDKTDLTHPKTGVALSTLYRAMVHDLATRPPHVNMQTPTLEAILAKSNKPTGSTKGDAEGDAPGAGMNGAGGGARTPTPPPSAPNALPSQMQSGPTQSQLYGVSSDIYPDYDKGRRLWTPIENEELEKLRSQISPVGDRYELDPETLEGSWRSLPWYQSVTLLHLRDASQENERLRFFYLTDKGNLNWLNGTSPPIHAVNAKAPIQINEANVLDYLRFFCFFVRGEEGPFHICEDAADPIIPQHPAITPVVEATVRPASYVGKTDKGYFLCDAVVFYSNAIFIANFAVQPGGMIEMLDDEPIAADLPVKIDAPLS